MKVEAVGRYGVVRVLGGNGLSDLTVSETIEESEADVHLYYEVEGRMDVLESCGGHGCASGRLALAVCGIESYLHYYIEVLLGKPATRRCRPGVGSASATTLNRSRMYHTYAYKSQCICAFGGIGCIKESAFPVHSEPSGSSQTRLRVVGLER